MLKSLIQRNIIFIYKNDRLLPIMLMQQLRQYLQRRRIQNIFIHRISAILHSQINVLILYLYPFSVSLSLSANKNRKRLGLSAYQFCQLIACILQR